MATATERYQVMNQLTQAGIAYDDACTLRRIAMTLHRWHELECGDGNNYGSWAIERDDNGDGPPFMVHHHYMHGCGKDTTTRTRIADREAGALKRLKTIMKKYSRRFLAYVQGDPRGSALFIVRRKDIPKGESIDAYYSRGIAIY